VKLRRIAPLLVGFVFVPATLLLTVGILILVFGSAARDYLFGGIILGLVAITIIGTAATLAVIYREARLAKLQTDFVNKVSHDLRTPLTSIRMFVETLQMGRLPDTARQQEALGIIAEETKRLSALINRLLDWARMESGKRAYDFRPEEVASMVDAALAAFEPQLLSQTAEVRRSFNGSYPPLYQAGYMLGALQLRALQAEVVGKGKMTDRAFHDAILRGNEMPIELERARLLGLPLSADYTARWRFDR